MSPTIYVLDTSYLIEIAGEGRDSNPVVSRTVRARFAAAAKRGGRFFIPLPCLFELGDHIADVKHLGKRAKLIQWLRTTVETSLKRGEPWTITPTQKPEEVLPHLLEQFEKHASMARTVGLVDSFAASEAERLKEEFRKLRCRVHIWTADGRLKELEPDMEPQPYVWKSNGEPR